jgi:ubiquinol-cytochrome c reductase cytochrome c1 subunit
MKRLTVGAAPSIRPLRGLLRTGLVATLLVAGPALGAGGEPPYLFKPDTANQPSVQRGARTYMNYCSGCHSLKYLRYNRIARDLGIPEQLLPNLMFTGDKPGEVVKSSMPGPSGNPAAPSASEQWFGRAPPDLTLTARERGADWVYSYLMTFYLAPGRPTGVDNLMLPGASMPHVLGDLQGYQAYEKPAEGEGHGGHAKPKLDLAVPGSLSPEDYKELVGDLVNFMVYAAEPGRNDRIALGPWVLMFTVIFGILAWLLKVEYWKDVH